MISHTHPIHQLSQCRASSGGQVASLTVELGNLTGVYKN
jgi:hypothetical protein